ncbi:MAG TPA: secondary thiamine-phosphate synthase enzyme YjbQ [Patescibacteria group bacterium]|nr:secondary thiamine-phosphate synthase enzyme YjbQ [Patescibacteria group bacterium]
MLKLLVRIIGSNMKIVISTKSQKQILDITKQIEEKLEGDGLVNIFLKHTTAALTTADLDPGTDKDYLEAIKSLTPIVNWQHPHDPKHFPDHLWSTLIGTDLTLPFSSSRLDLGTWQRVILIELDGPRERQIQLSIIKT